VVVAEIHVMDVIQLSPQIEPLYEAFVSNHSQGMFYYSLRYRNLLCDLLQCQEHYLVAIHNEQVQGVLPVMSTVGSAGRVYNSLPFYGSHGGPLAETPESAKALIEAFNTLASAPDCLGATLISNLFVPTEPLPVHTHTDYRIGQITDLSGDFESRFESSARRNVKKAASQGIKVAVDVDALPVLREMHQQNIRAIGGIPKSDLFFDLAAKHFVPHKDYKIYVASIENEIIGSLLLFYYRDTVEYFTPATKDDARSLQPLPIILNTAMREAAQQGYRWWNWGGTWETQTGVYRFKRKWGAQDSHYMYYVRINDPSVLSWPKARFLNEYPNFYVAPFGALVSNSDFQEDRS